MKRKHLFALVGISILFACKKYNENSKHQKSEDFISEAQHYIDNIPLVSNSKIPLKTALWDQAIIQNTELFGDIIIVPLSYTQPLYTRLDDYHIHVPMENLTFLLAYKDSKKQIHAEVITKIPDSTYLNKKYTEKEFSGTITAEAWNGDYLRGYKIQKNNWLRANRSISYNSALHTETASPIQCSNIDVYDCVSTNDGPWNCNYIYTIQSCTGDGTTGSGGGGGGGGAASGPDRDTTFIYINSKVPPQVSDLCFSSFGFTQVIPVDADGGGWQSCGVTGLQLKIIPTNGTPRWIAATAPGVPVYFGLPILNAIRGRISSIQAAKIAADAERTAMAAAFRRWKSNPGLSNVDLSAYYLEQMDLYMRKWGGRVTTIPPMNLTAPVYPASYDCPDGLL
ncbi:MAG: hypothetical protein J7623_07160 [Chitinophaga sp.]|uniref:hypothetical protein n=1 Tax=Chitinophaga sp. TaxID=1869181 RepID=UPI001B0F5F77|nr:hypothetical protein [Chitinophaga sp.]MBO9728402.1 hypothetical protein [Chitinophaga sp.]